MLIRFSRFPVNCCIIHVNFLARCQLHSISRAFPPATKATPSIYPASSSLFQVSLLPFALAVKTDSRKLLLAVGGVVYDFLDVIVACGDFSAFALANRTAMQLSHLWECFPRDCFRMYQGMDGALFRDQA